MVKRIYQSFIYSAFFGMLANLLIEIIVRLVSGNEFAPLTPEYQAMFPSYSMALLVDMLLYGVIGATFSGMIFIYELDRLGFVLQSLIYYLVTGLVWIPIATFIWQLQKYPQALMCTIFGYLVTDIIMTIVAYQTTKRNIVQLNAVLEQEG